MFNPNPGPPMNSDTALAPSLDTLAAAWMAGDDRARDRLFADLHVRFSAIAKRRVQPGQDEDLVQEALHIVLRKAVELRKSENVLPWSLTILRNVIGNHYQARRWEGERMNTAENILDTVADPAAGPGGPGDLAPAIEAALEKLARRFPRCGRMFEAILRSLEQGGGSNEISQRAFDKAQKAEPGLTRGGWYTALHRCRAQLRTLMEQEDNHE